MIFTVLNRIYYGSIPLNWRRLVDHCRRLSQTANSAEHREPIGAVGCPRRVRSECRSVRHSFIISIILFNLLLCLFCMRFCSACSLFCRICSGIHFPAVLRVISNSRAQADTLPPGCSLNHCSTRAWVSVPGCHIHKKREARSAPLLQFTTRQNRCPPFYSATNVRSHMRYIQ